MKQVHSFTGVLIFLFALFVSGCASTPEQSDENLNEVFYETIEDTQSAAVDALTVLGFEIKKNDANYVEGYRPRKLGLAVGSGGETVGIWINPISKDKVDVKVNTAKTMLGRLGQKTWDDDVISEMKKALLQKRASL